jgi:hypothetical protein
LRQAGGRAPGRGTGLPRLRRLRGTSLISGLGLTPIGSWGLLILFCSGVKLLPTLCAALVVAGASFAATSKGLDPKPAVVVQKAATVTLDVKDAEVRDILKSMKMQCGIKNLLVDPQVEGSGTFFIRDLPCRTAFEVVFRTLGLQSVIYPNSVIAVGPRR